MMLKERKVKQYLIEGKSLKEIIQKIREEQERVDNLLKKGDRR